MLPVGIVAADVVPAGAASPVVIGPADLSIKDGESLVVYAVGSLDGDTLGVLTESITGLGSNPTRIDTGNSPIDDGGGTNLSLWIIGGGVLLLLVVGAAATRARRDESTMASPRRVRVSGRARRSSGSVPRAT